MEEQDRRFEERLTGRLAPEAYRFGAPLLLVAGLFAAFGWVAWALAVGVLTGFVVAFFRNPRRPVPEGEHCVVAPADGRVIEVGEVELPGGEKGLRIGIFLSIFNVHVNRAPVSGRVLRIERSGEAYRAAFDPAAALRNVQCRMTLEMADGRRADVVQITGLIARRIVCHPEVGEWLQRGVRYGLIRFGSRTDVVLPLGTRARVSRGDRVRGGASVIAELSPGEVAL